MKALLICPDSKSEMALLSRRVPLAAVPTYGQSLLEYWLCDLAGQGVKEVMVLASDRPQIIGDICGDGSRWGLKAEVIAEPREPTPAEALLRYAQQLNCVPPNRCIAVLDHFPGYAQQPLFISYAAWFKAVRGWLPSARTPDRVGIQEVEPGIFVGLNARISPAAELYSPCWIGRNAIVGARAIIGPRSIVEDGAFVEQDAEVRSSYVGPDTYVGRYTEIRDSIAWGNFLLDWNTAVETDIPDRFILSELRPMAQNRKQPLFSRLARLYSRIRKQPALEEVT